MVLSLLTRYSQNVAGPKSVVGVLSKNVDRLTSCSSGNSDGVVRKLLLEEEYGSEMDLTELCNRSISSPSIR